MTPEAPGAHPPPSRAGHLAAVSAAAVVIVVLAGLGGYWFLTHPTAPPAAHTGGHASPPKVNVSSIDLTGSSVNVSTVTQTVPELVPDGSFNVSADLTQACGTYGCSTGVRSVSVALPFTLLGSQPSLPFNWSTTSIQLVQFEFRAPSTAGTYRLHANVVAAPPPGPANVTSVSFSTVYAGIDSGFLTVSDPSLPVKVKANSTLPVTLVLTSASWYPETITSLTLAPPFRLLSIQATLPETIAPNGTLSVSVSVIAPAPGTYTLSGRVNASTPLVSTGNVTWSMTVYPNPFYSVNPVLGPFPSELRLGQQVTLDLRIYNNDTSGHVFEVTGVRGGWNVVGTSPTGNITVPASGEVQWTIILRAPTTEGLYNLVVQISYWS